MIAVIIAAVATTHVYSCLAHSIPQDISEPGFPRKCLSDDECGGGATCRLPSSTSPWVRWGGLERAIRLKENKYCHPRRTVEGETDCLGIADSASDTPAQFPGLTPQQGWPDALSNVDFTDLVFLMVDHWCIGSASMHTNATSGIETMNAPALKVLSMQGLQFETFPSGVAAFLSRMTPGSGLTSALDDGCDNVYTYDPSNTSDPRVPCIHVDLSNNNFCRQKLDSGYAAARKFALLCDAPMSTLAYASCEEAIHSLGEPALSGWVEEAPALSGNGGGTTGGTTTSGTTTGTIATGCDSTDTDDAGKSCPSGLNSDGKCPKGCTETYTTSTSTTGT